MLDKQGMCQPSIPEGQQQGTKLKPSSRHYKIPFTGELEMPKLSEMPEEVTLIPF